MSASAFDAALAAKDLPLAATELERLAASLTEGTPEEALDQAARRLDRLRDQVRDSALALRLVALLPALWRLPLGDGARDRIIRAGHRLSLRLQDGGAAVRAAYAAAGVAGGIR